MSGNITPTPNGIIVHSGLNPTSSASQVIVDQLFLKLEQQTTILNLQDNGLFFQTSLSGDPQFSFTSSLSFFRQTALAGWHLNADEALFFRDRFSGNGLFIRSSATVLAHNPQTYLSLRNTQLTLKLDDGPILDFNTGLNQTTLSNKLGFEEVILGNNVVIKKNASNYLLFTDDDYVELKSDGIIALRASQFIVSGAGLNGHTGLRGPTGIHGPTGLFGFTGLMGFTGLGITGLKGTTGVRGRTGIKGNPGNTGLRGRTGLRGFTGPAGAPQGITGLRGRTGIRGLKGDTGPRGATGVRGRTGILGRTGFRGATGIQGKTGIRGRTGLRGITGFKGVTGIQGRTGFGIQGIQGLTGLKGLTGQGPTGPIGNTGVQGSTGIRGLTGFRGRTGLRGRTGVRGITGLRGRTGLRGLTGLRGRTGIIGKTGIQGVTGLPGLLPNFLEKSVAFGDISGTLIQDNSNFNWDNTKKQLGLKAIPPTNDSTTLFINGTLSLNVLSVDANHSLTENESVILVDTTGGNVTLSLPLANTCKGRMYMVKRMSPLANPSNVIISRTGADLIDLSATSIVLAQDLGSTILISDGVSRWIVIGVYKITSY